MTGEEFDDFATLWRDEPSAEEQKALEALARRTSRRARLTQQVEIGVGAILLMTLAIALILNPAPAALFAGALLAFALIWSSWRRFTLAQISLLVDTTSREVLLDTAINSTEARLRRSRLGLWLLVPGYVLGAMTKYALVTGSLTGFLTVLVQQTSPFTKSGIATIVLLGGALIYFLRHHQGIKRELDNLRDLRRQYRAEADLDNLAHDDTSH